MWIGEWERRGRPGGAGGDGEAAWPAREPRGCLVVFWSEVLEARGEKAADEDRAGLGCEEAASSGPGFVPRRPSPAAYVPEQDTVSVHSTHRHLFLLRSNVFFNLFLI